MTLLAPIFLVGLLAVGLPLWLHRLSSENPNRQAFSSLMFLEPGEPRRVLARKLRYLLLLALRIALLVLLAFTFAGPMLERSEPPGATDATPLHVVLVDRSASMGLGQRWPRARAQVDDIIAGVPAEAPLELVAAGHRLEILAEPGASRGEIRNQLAVLEPGPFHVDYGQTMLALDSALRAVERAIVLHFVTDLQSASLPARFAELAPRRPMELNVYDVGRAGEDNWAVEAVQGSAVEARVEASIRAHMAAPETRTIVLEVNGRPMTEQLLTAEPGATVTAEFTDVALVTGPNRVRVRLAPSDALVADDERFLVLKRPQPRPVLLVSGDPRGRDMLFLESALQTLTELSLEIERITAEQLAERTLTGHAFVIVTDAGALAEPRVEQLRAYAQEGGAVWLAFGPRSSSLTQVPLTGHTLQAFAQSGAPASTSYATVGLMDLQHPGLTGADALRGAKFFRHVAIGALPGDAVLARLDQGDPLLLERALGNGRVLVFASSLDREWTDLPLQPVFVPLIAGLSEYLAGGTGRLDASFGSTLTLRQLGLSGGQIFDPSGRPALGIGGLRDEVVLDQVGFYEVVGGGVTELVAVNLDPRESDVRRMDDATLERWRAFSRPDAGRAPAASAAASEPEPAPLWPALLVALIMAAIVESWVGNWHLRVRRGLAA
jgi:hypothetical protein